jgi:hypothetical protein
MTKVDEYREKLRGLASWDAFLLSESRLPGPRANLELAFAVALEGSEEQLVGYARMGPTEAPKNTQEEFLAVCGVIGLGYLAARGDAQHLDQVRERASDPRWRIREAVALGLQKYGETSFDELFALLKDWSGGSLLERRAVVATLCEPTLLRDKASASKIIEMLDWITTSVLDEEERRSEEFRVLRKTLGYGWSVAVAAHPPIGKPKMEQWIQSDDSDVLWVMRNNLKKNRMLKMDSAWVEAQVEVVNR